jgi:hypothetical protein
VSFFYDQQDFPKETKICLLSVLRCLNQNISYLSVSGSTLNDRGGFCLGSKEIKSNEIKSVNSHMELGYNSFGDQLNFGFVAKFTFFTGLFQSALKSEIIFVQTNHVTVFVLRIWHKRKTGIPKSDLFVLVQQPYIV